MMTVEELEAGKTWVSACLEELAREMAVTIEYHGWIQGPNVYEPHRLHCRIKGRELSLTFSYADLCACSRKEVVRMTVRARIKGFLASWV